MHNVFINQARRRRYEIEQAMEEVPAVAVRATQGEQLELEDVDRVLRSLSTEQREVVLLVAVEQLTYEEVSQALDIPIGTVMSRLSRARSPRALEPRSRRGSLLTRRTRSGCARMPSRTRSCVRSTTRCSTSPCRQRCSPCARARGGATRRLRRYSRSASGWAGPLAGR